ncbi:M16 family metallopeptidase [Niabella drilacis]|uniref:Predicted Zn-dependent peptidase n=1 Tax=Niabella drilacis (strain DSM 25811 / CCM 8410 / CCUG 62505 / LMG 26954 / E90) TaxID=1285928 RepID=A0A1G6Z343_NIADE|nr:insulinase family protein [Niabella drilacis]SDD97184.1 Predicted Zn-dependent peptidase [Niabella drilacis]
MKLKLIACVAASALLVIHARAQQKSYQWMAGSTDGIPYRYVSNDPMNTRFYTLKNGLTVILTENKKEPRITAKIAVRAGSNTDPKDHTGLAHYLEHLLFKGTSEMGSTSYAKEKPYLDRIENLYEQYNSTTDTAKRRAIYKEIDQVSGEAAKISIANEYTKLMATMGSQGTNAHTWVEETVYEENIPSTSLNKFLKVQADRFRDPVFRIFHTELEAVYEEKNRTMDNDGWKVMEAMHRNLFPTSNYGQQTTIGTIEHLKNPSLKAIRQYFDKYYVPDNMAIILAGDFNTEAVIKEVNKQFAYMKSSPVTGYEHAPEPEIKGPVVTNILGPSAENVQIGFRGGPEGSREAMMADLLSTILANGKAGLIDLNLNQQQKILSGGAYLRQYKDYGVFDIYATAKQEQSLETVKDLLFEQIDIIKKGNFDDQLLKAIVANYKLDEIRGLSSNDNRASQLMQSFIANKGEGWIKNVSYLQALSKITKKDVVDFANQFFKADNYTVIYKRKGEDKSITKVEKPAITPVATNDNLESDYVKKVNALPATPVKPLWIDYTKAIQKGKAGSAELLYVPNKENELFSLYYRFDMGSWNNKILPIAASYLSYIGTDKNSAEAINKAFYNIACNYAVNVGTENTTITISGLQENFEKAARLFEDLLLNCKADEAALTALKGRLAKARANRKLDKGAIMQGLSSYASYGANNPFNYTLSDEELKNLDSKTLIDALHQLTGYKHTAMYFGPVTMAAISKRIAAFHKVPSAFNDYPRGLTFNRTIQTANQVLFTNYDMVQSEIRWMRNTEAYDPAKELTADVFNNYFGGGMGGVVFQTIRESKALAYSTYALYLTPSKKEDRYSFIAYVGSQADKMKEAIAGMNDLINTLPKSDKSFESAKASLKNDLETDRITNEGILFSYLAAQRKGLNYDIRKTKYEQLGGINFDNIRTFHQQELSGKPYTYCVLGSDKKIKTDDLEKIGQVKTLTLEEIFGY